MRKHFIVFIQKASIMFTLLAITSGCANATSTPPSPTLPATQVPQAASSTETPLPPTETPIPTSTQTPFIPKATIKIVVHVPLSGDSAAAGTDNEHAVELAVQQLAGPLNELGYKIELVSYDDKRDIGTAVANSKEIVADPQILCGVGHYNSNIMIQVSEIYHQAGLAFVSPANTAALVTDHGYLEVNRIVGRDDGQGIAGALFAQAQGYKSVFIISQSGLYGKQNADYFRREASKLNIKIVGNATTDLTEKFDQFVTQVMSANPDVVYFAGLADQVGPFIREARAAGYKGTFLSIDGVDTPSFAQLAGPLAVEGGGAYFTTMAPPANYYPDATKFMQDFQSAYGTSPLPFTAQAYDAAGICLAAIESAAKSKNGELPTRNEVAKAIRALMDYKGITGTYNFNKKGDPTLADYFVYKVVSSDPDKWGQNTIVTSFKVPPPQ